MNDDERRTLPDGWAMTTMGAVAEVVGGGTPKTKVAGNFDHETGHPWLTPADLTGYRSKTIGHGRRYLTDQGLKTSAAKYVPAGTVLFSSRAPIGYVAIAANPVTTNQGFRSFVPSEALDPHYAYYYLGSITALAEQLASGTTFSELSGSKAKTLPLPLPPITEQRRIAARLDEIEARRSATAARLQSARTIIDRLRGAILTAACTGRLTATWRQGRVGPTDSHDDAPEAAQDGLPPGWRRERVGAAFSIQNGRAFPSKEYQRPGDIRLLRPGNLRGDGRIEWSHRNTVGMARAWADDYPDFVLGEGELVMNLTAQSLKDEFLGRVCLKTDSEPALLNQRIARFRTLGGFDTRPYALIYFKSRMFRSFVDGLDSGTLIRHIHSKQLVDLTIPLPPPDEQLEIVRKVGVMLEIADQLGTRLNELDERVGGMATAALAKAFRGQLVPTESALAEAEGRGYESADQLLAKIPADAKPLKSARRRRTARAA